MRLRDYLAETKTKANAFGLIVGVPNKQTMSRYVRGDRMPPPRVLLAIKDKTGGQVTPEDFAADCVARDAA